MLKGYWSKSRTFYKSS